MSNSPLAKKNGGSAQMEETRDQRIARLTEEFRKLLEEKFPEKGSTMRRIEELTEEIGREIEQKIE